MDSGRTERLRRGVVIADGPAASSLLLSPAAMNHIVQFYDTDNVLVASVSDFLATGLSLGETTLVAATPEHRRRFVEALVEKGVPVDDACQSGQLVLLDAQETLDAFMVDGVPDDDRFRSVIGSAIEQASHGEPVRPLRAYGEMVDLLWREGNAEAALRLEEMWNLLAERHSFSLLCSYLMGGMYKRVGGRSIDEVCTAHTHVIPAPSYARLRAEVAQRENVERALRESLQELQVAKQSLVDRLQASVGPSVDHASGDDHAAQPLVSLPDETTGEWLVRVLSRDLQGPLGAIVATAQDLRRHTGDQAVAAAADRIVASSDRIAAAIRQISSLAGPPPKR